MSLRDHLPAASWIWQALTGRHARRLFLAFTLVLMVASAALRTWTYVLTRRMEAVIAGLSKLEIDKTTEEELVRTVPHLVRSQWDRPVTRTVETGNVDTGTEHFYYSTISNEESWMKFGRLIEPVVRCCAKPTFTKDFYERSWILTLTDVMGFRYVYFVASVTLLEGKVSGVAYGVADRLGFPRPAFQILSARSAHSLWMSHQGGFEVQSTDDESPQFRVDGGEHGLSVVYTFDSPRDLRLHAFKTDLSCFWGLRSCYHVRQLAPFLWQDKTAIQAATLARLQSPKPCPDRILAGRVRYLPDIDAVLLESKGFKSERVNEDGVRGDEVWTNYRLVEVLRGNPTKSWDAVRNSATVPYPGDYGKTLTNTGLQWANAGERVLAFSNHSFDSCQMVLATPSALEAVRNAASAPRRAEDQIMRGLM